MADSIKILLIEDDNDDVLLFRETVNDWHDAPVRIELEVHRSLEDAWPSLSAGDFDIVFSDYFLSGVGAGGEESAITSEPLIQKVVDMDKPVPIVLWTSSSRLDVGPLTIRALLGQKVRFMSKAKFNVGSLRYVVWAVQNKAVSILIIDENKDDANLLRKAVVMTEFYNFNVNSVDNVSDACHSIESGGDDLYLLDQKLESKESEALIRNLLDSQQPLSRLLITGASDEEPSELVQELMDKRGIECVILDDLESSEIGRELIRYRNKLDQ